MGQITIFEKSNCAYCVRVHAVLSRLIETVCKDLKHSGVDNPRIQIKVVDCGTDGALAALCIRLTGTFTVPHIFFNEEYIGDASQFITLDQSCKEGCNLLISKLRSLALKPDPDPPFPPRPDASMVKVTEELAFSSQPTNRQLMGLSSFGFRSVLNVLRKDSPAFNRNEETLVEQTGVVYRHFPMQIVTSHSLLQAIDAMRDLPTPLLVHDDSGQRAGLVVLLRAAQQMIPGTFVPKSTIFKWGTELGLNFEAFELPVVQVLECFRKESQDSNGKLVND